MLGNFSLRPFLVATENLIPPALNSSESGGHQNFDEQDSHLKASGLINMNKYEAN